MALKSLFSLLFLLLFLLKGIDARRVSPIVEGNHVLYTNNQLVSVGLRFPLSQYDITVILLLWVKSITHKYNKLWNKSY
jgi:hypothetical protein